MSERFDKYDVFMKMLEVIEHEQNMDEVILSKEQRQKAKIIIEKLNLFQKQTFIDNIEGGFIMNNVEVDTMGDKHIGRDNIEISGNAHVNRVTTGTGDSFQGDYAQKLLQTMTPQSSQDELIKLLSFVQQEIPKLPISEEIKEEIGNEVKGAEIQAKKDQPDKEKIAGKLKSATESLQESAKTIKEAVTVGNLIGKAILWCGEQWINWM